jgi:hypothetical protein
MVFQRNGLARENTVMDRLGRLPYLAKALTVGSP